MKTLIVLCLLATAFAGCSASSADLHVQEEAVCPVLLKTEFDVVLEAGAHSLPVGYDRTVQGTKIDVPFQGEGDLRHVTATAKWEGITQEPRPLRVTIAPAGDEKPFHSQWFNEGPSPLTAYGFANGEEPDFNFYQVTIAPAWEEPAGDWIQLYPMNVALSVREMRSAPC